MKPVFFSFPLIEMFVVIDLRIDVHNDDKMGVGVIFNCDSNYILSVDVNNVFDDLRCWAKLIRPDDLLLVCTDVL